MDRWYGTDEFRESWCLITVATDSTGAERFITSCEIGEGNQDQLVETEALTAENPDEEAKLLQELGERLDERRYNGITLVTPSRDTLAILRTRFLECNQIQQPTLRGFRHIAVVELLANHFSDELMNRFPDLTVQQRNNDEQISVDTAPSEIVNPSVTALWKTRTAIGPLVPPDALQGTQL